MTELVVPPEGVLLPDELEVWGSQTPTFLWAPGYEPESSFGTEVIDLGRRAGLVGDLWQELAVSIINALDPYGRLRFFEILLILSRQNGKGGVLELIELAWLFLLNYRLVTHSAHLFETSKEHFLRMKRLILDNPEFERRIHKMYDGRGSEEIILRGPKGREITGQARLKFMSRKGGQGRGFTGDKVVVDECMYLEHTSTQASVPSMATRPDAQIIYAGSAGMRHSTHMAYVLRRAKLAARQLAEQPGRRTEEDRLAVLEWAAEPAVFNEAGDLVAGDDPRDPHTIAKVNPAFGPRHPARISWRFVKDEAKALGGWLSQPFAIERLGIGDYPTDDAMLWEVIEQDVWKACEQPGASAEGLRTVLAVAGDPERDMAAIVAASRRLDGRPHLEVIERRRGTGWLTARLRDIVAGLAVDNPDNGEPVIALKGDITGHILAELSDVRQRTPIQVYGPTEQEYAQWCQAFVEQAKVGQLVHLGDQKSLNDAVGSAAKKHAGQGGWRWDLETSRDASPVRAATLALGGLDRYAPVEDTVGDVW